MVSRLPLTIESHFIFFINFKGKTMEQFFNFELKTINQEKINTVNARELWKKLESKQQFSDWIKNRIEKYGFVEGEDYIKINHNTQLSKENRVDKFVEPENQGFMTRPIDYYLTIDMAKELCMVENNDWGRKIRKYFIECEKHFLLNDKLESKKVQNRFDMTNKIQEVYGKDAPFYVYSNYTKLIYKRVFGVSKANDVRKMFHMTENEDIRRTHKIPPEKQLLITDLEYNVHCYLQILKAQQKPKEQCYELVKQFLFQNLIASN